MKYQFLKTTAALAVTLLAAPQKFDVTTHYQTVNAKYDAPEKLFADLQRGKLPIMPFLDMVSPSLNSVFAEGGVGDARCEIQQGVRAKCASAWMDYEHGALKYFNGTLCRFNNETSAEVENVLCHFRRSMGIKVDVNNLPLSATKTMGDITVQVDITAPTEGWAQSAGYEAKGVVTVNTQQYMVIYWGGSAESSKGFMIEGAGSELGGSRAGYLTWDLTDPANQRVRMYHAGMSSGSYLSDAVAPSGKHRGDASIYGAVTFNKNTKQVATQVVLIEQRRGSNPGNNFGCFRMYAQGVKDSDVVVAKTENSKNSTGHATSFASKKLDEMDGVGIVDALDTPNFSGTQYTTQSGLEGALSVASNADVFDVSCQNIAGLGGSGQLYGAATVFVDFSKSVSDVFP